MDRNPYLHDWAKGGFIDMVADFSGVYMTKVEYEAEACPWGNLPMWHEEKAKLRSALDSVEFQGIDVLLASYANANYSGDAFVLFRRGLDLYEVNGGHCSCHGLEGQWSPELTTIEALTRRLEEGSLGSDSYSENVFSDDLRAVLNELRAT